MIKMIDSAGSDIPAFLKKYGAESVCTSALLKTYGNNSKVITLYRQTVSGETTGIIVIYGDCAYITACERADFSELEEFACLSGAGSVRIGPECSELFRAPRDFTESGAVFMEMGDPNLKPPCPGINEHPELDEVHRILSGYFPVAGREMFKADMQARINHAAASAITVKVNGLTAAVACILFESDGYGMLGGVATLENFRCRGYASALVSHLCGDLLRRGKVPVITSVNPAAVSVYKALGFRETGRLGIYVREDKK